MESIYPFILYCILCFPGITAEALLVVNKRAATVYHAIRKGLAANHIAEFTLKHNRHITKYLVLTASGILYLQEKSTRLTLCNMLDRLHGYPSESWWSNEIMVFPSDDLRFRVSGVSTEYMLHACSVSSSNLFWNVAGASTAVTLLPETINSPFCDAVRVALTGIYMFDMPSPFKYKTGLVYEDAFSVKCRLAKIVAPELARAGRYSGILITDHTAYTVYHGSKDGMSWAPLARKRDLDAMLMYSKNLSPLGWSFDQAHHGIILVQNAKMFFDLLCDSAYKNRDKRGHIKYKLGEGYASFVFFPVSFSGMKLARRFISDDPDTVVHNLTMHIQKSLFPDSNISRQNRILLNHGGISIYQMIFIDAVEIYSLIQNHLNESFDILFLDWQLDYYSRIFDITEIKTTFKLDNMIIMHATVRVKPEIVALFTPTQKSSTKTNAVPPVNTFYFIP